MTKWKKRWMVGIGEVGLIVAMVAFPGFADKSHGMMGHGGHDQEEQDDQSGHYLKHLLKHAKEIGLTQEQITKVKAIQLDFKRSEARLEADEKVAKLELQALLEDEKADLNTIQAKVDQLKKAEAACLFTAIKSKRNAMVILTPDQREKEHAVHEQMMSGGQHGAGGGGMGHGGMMGGRGGMGGMMGGGMMGGSGHGQGSGDHGSGGAGGGQQHQH
ncbi:MAG: periplasmic heavy metal sensor [Nitrospira sp.]|nr:periplasmic heavy metal sensor [Nitrospira sp.]MDH5194649.1 periplasmic heavy metal sensor [Nitrospira sp.]